MAICGNCKKEYFTKVCVPCRNIEEREKKRNFNNKNKKSNNNSKPISIVIGLMIIIGAGYTVYKNISLNKTNEFQEKEISRLNYENVNLKKRVQRSDELTQRYIRINKQLTRDNRNNKSKTIYANKSNKIYIQPKKRTTTKTKKYTKNKNYSKKTTRATTQVKKYHKYNGYKSIKSDSKITISIDNKFHSNAPIYATYKRRILNADCTIKTNLYKVVDECKGTPLLTSDTLYFSKGNKRSLQKFDSNHMIECRYSKEHGLMHDCKVKML